MTRSDAFRGPSSAVAIVRVEPGGLSFKALPGETVMAAARRQGYKWPTVCEMQATCTVCHLIVTSELHSLGPIEGRERDGLLSLLRRYPDRAPGEVRLACQAVVLGDVTVTKRGVTGPSPLARCEEQ